MSRGAQYEAAAAGQEQGQGQQEHTRAGAQLEERYAFVGCRPAVVPAICRNGLLRVGHPLNPSQSMDPGWFGDPKQGVYVAQCSDYCIKYANGGRPLASGESARIVLLKVLPGRVYRCGAVEMGRAPEPGYDSHESPHALEWYLPLEGQCCPMAVLTVRADDTRANLADDQ